MISPRLRRHGAAIAGYIATALAFNWPLPLHLGTRLTGPITGDTGVYVWNVWLFRHEIVAHGRFPLFTMEILSLTPPVDLSLHNYTLFANLLAFPLIPLFGVTATFNVVYLALVVLTAWAMFLLARTIVGRTGEAWLAGLLFGFSPAIVARSEAHFSLVAAAPLPIFTLLLVHADRHRDVRYAAAAGLAAAWAATCDVYYGIFCVLIALCYLAARHTRLRFPEARTAWTGWRCALDAAIFACAAIVAVVVATGGRDFEIGHRVVHMRTLYTPVLLLTVFTIARALATWPPSVSVRAIPPWPRVLQLVLGASIACLMVLLPVFYALYYRLADGGQLHGPIYWRSSPGGVDLLSLFAPNPNSPIFGGPWRTWLTGMSGGYVENVASLTFVGIGVIGLAVWRRGFRPSRVWLAMLLFFVALSLGPFVQIGGVNTYVPGPWALLRYVPAISATRTPARYDMVAMMAFSVIFAAALAHLAGRPSARRRAVLALAGVLLMFELAPLPKTLYSAEIPEVYRIIARDPGDVRVLELPFGIRSGEWSEGDFTAASQFYQTVHEKPLIGGYLSRISRGVVERQHQYPMVRQLMRLSEGRTMPVDRVADLDRRAPGFIQRARVGYVVMDTARTPPRLREVAIRVFRLVKIAEDRGHELYVPRQSPGAPAIPVAER